MAKECILRDKEGRCWMQIFNNGFRKVSYLGRLSAERLQAFSDFHGISFIDIRGDDAAADANPNQGFRHPVLADGNGCPPDAPK